MYSITCRYWWFSCPLPVSFSSCPSGVIVLAFVLCWLLYIVGLTMQYGSKSTGGKSRGTNTPPESTGNMASVPEPVRLSDLDLKTRAHTDRDDALCENTNNEIDTHTETDTHLVDSQPETLTDPGAGSDDTSARHVVSHDVRAGESTHNLGPRTETDTHSEIHNTTQNKQNTTICIKSQKDTLSLTTSTAGKHTYVVTPTHSPQNNTHTKNSDFILVAWTLSRLSAAINPLVYNLMSTRYRHAVRSLVHTHCLTPSHRLSTTPSSG